MSLRPSYDDDPGYRQECGWQFYGNEIKWGECIVLEPVELPNSGVIFGLEFRTEDELWGWSDKGIIRWKFDSHSRGLREKSELF